MQDSPFESPTTTSESDSADWQAQGHKPLYSNATVMTATFFGSILAGGILTVLNGRQHPDRLVRSIIYTAIFVFGYLLLISCLNFSGAGFVCTIIGVMVSGGINDQLFSKELMMAKRHDWPFAPWWHGPLVGIGLMLSLIALFAAIINASIQSY